MKLAPEASLFLGEKNQNKTTKTNAKKPKTTNKSDISIYWTRKKKAMVGDSVKKTVPYITLSIYTHFFPKDKKMASI